ncbi:MAG: hypothetical protein J6K58_14290 [Lachnospiraceae bacterium]|nr:hypothetical protein [Lachnospiraceae bacterium]
MQIYRKWTGLRLEIVEYCKSNKISENDFRFLDVYEWQNVYDKVLEHFVDERYARNHGLYWSNITEGGFRKNIDRIYAFHEGVEQNASWEWIEKLSEIVECEQVYLLLQEKKQRAKYRIAECDITKNHHDIVQFIGKGLDLEMIKNVCKK